ncbi:MAG: glutamate 5-kinase [Pseudomonadota bacterium]
MEAVTETRNADLLTRARRVVIKVGSALLVDQVTGRLRRDWLAGLAQDVAEMRARGQGFVLVSSGAIALGRGALGLAPGPLSLEASQAAAAVGQSRLVQGWEEALAPHDITTAQVLLTLEDTQKRRRYLNGRATLAALLDLGVVPVVNENDTVATDEIRYGDNDRLAARVALMAEAEVAVLLSDVDGLYTANPRDDGSARHLAEVTAITPEIEAMAGGTGTADAKGGMKTKVMAAKIATQGGCAMAVTRGDVDRPLASMAQGARTTWFRATTEPRTARKQWIAGMKPMGTLTVDPGAVQALVRGKSLLPAGVRAVEGDFRRGDPVAIATADGTVVASGLATYSAPEATRIIGLHSHDIAARLGYPGRAGMVHADDMVVWAD